MAALRSRCRHIFCSCGVYLLIIIIILLSFFFPRLFSAVAKWRRLTEIQDVKIPQKITMRTIAQLCRVVSSQLRHVSTIEKNLSPNWYTILTFSGADAPKEFCQVQNSLCVQVLRCPILAAILCSTRAVGITQTLQHGVFTYRTRGGVFLAGGLSLWLVHWCGTTCYRTTWETRQSVETHSAST